MSYKNKLQNYQSDCLIEIGKFVYFSDYIKYFWSIIQSESSENNKLHGLDIGAGPGGCNGQYFQHCILDGCDADSDVVDTLPELYKNKFVFNLGIDELPYKDRSLDFIICSCVIQHLNSFNDLVKGISEITRVLKPGGKFYLMFKAGTNDTTLTHFNQYYRESRTFRVYHPNDVTMLCSYNGLKLLYRDTLVDDNWIPYCCLVFEKYNN